MSANVKAKINLLQETAGAIRAGQDVARAYSGNRNGGFTSNPDQSELKRRSNGTAIDYHFSLPYILDSNGNPTHHDFVKRDSIDDDGSEINLTHDYVHSEADEKICKLHALCL